MHAATLVVVEALVVLYGSSRYCISCARYGGRRRRRKCIFWRSTLCHEDPEKEKDGVLLERTAATSAAILSPTPAYKAGSVY